MILRWREQHRDPVEVHVFSLTVDGGSRGAGTNKTEHHDRLVALVDQVLVRRREIEPGIGRGELATGFPVSPPLERQHREADAGHQPVPHLDAGGVLFRTLAECAGCRIVEVVRRQHGNVTAFPQLGVQLDTVLGDDRDPLG